VNAINEKNITTTVCTHPLKCRDGSGLGLQPGSDVISSAAGAAVTVTANNATSATPHKKKGAITVVSLGPCSGKKIEIELESGSSKRVF
jgi:hypothetical protein